MEELLISREEAEKFLKEEVAGNYRTLSEFERWAENYEGPFEKYLPKVVEYLREKNKGNARSFGFGSSDIEDILKAIPLKDF